jgi:hypothetical protein
VTENEIWPSQLSQTYFSECMLSNFLRVVYEIKCGQFSVVMRVSVQILVFICQ